MGAVEPGMAAAKRTGAPPPPVSPELRNTFAENLRAARTEAGLSQRRLAELTGVSRKYISEIEASAVNASLDIVTLLATHLGKSPHSLLMPKRRI
jgi:transcriptional regulator with XRE-family HTH domain